ncbi:MAG: murein biosynthesis integral membrane protein MurJ [Alphaproteobacteria bacterium]
MRLLKSTAIISSLTMVSRVLGLVRDIMLAKFLGAGLINDALITATKLPNLFRRMFAEGAFNAAFIPLYARRIEEDGDVSAANFAGEALAALAFLVALIVVFFQITMPWTLNLIGGGLDKAATGPDGIVPYDLAVLYARVTMPYLFFMSLGALFSGVLNTRNYFAMAAFVPVLLNLVWISILAIMSQASWSLETLALYLSIGMTASGFLQAGFLVWGIRRAGIEIRFFRPRMTPGVKRLFTLGLPGMIAAGITHINLMVSHFISTFQEGAPSWLYYSDRLYQLPLGIIGIAMGIALLPALSRRLRAGDEIGAVTSMNRAVEIAAYLTLPAAVALAVMPDFLVGGLFERGEFSAFDTEQTAKALLMFAFGLPAFVLLKILTPAFFARENTRTPMIYAGISAVINLAFGAALFVTVGFFGLALATSIAAWGNVLCLAFILRRDGHFKADVRLLKRLPRIGASAGFMGIALWFLSARAELLLTGSILRNYSLLLAVCAAGFFVYLVFAFIFRAVELPDIREALSRNR